MAQHLLIGDIGGAADRARPDRAAAAAAAGDQLARLAADADPPAGRAAALGRQPLHLAPPALYQAALTSEPLHALQHACFIGFGVLMWMPLVGPLPEPAWFGIGGEARLRASPCASPAPCSATSSCGRATSSTPTTRAGEADFGTLAAHRPGDRGRDHDRRGRAGHARRARLALPALGAAGHRAAAAARPGRGAGGPAREARAGRAAAAGQGGRLEERIKGSAG